MTQNTFEKCGASLERLTDYCATRIAQDHLVLLVSGKSFDLIVMDINEVDFHQEGACRVQIYDAPPSRLIS